MLLDGLTVGMGWQIQRNKEWQRGTSCGGAGLLADTHNQACELQRDDKGSEKDADLQFVTNHILCVTAATKKPNKVATKLQQRKYTLIFFPLYTC